MKNEVGVTMSHRMKKKRKVLKKPQCYGLCDYRSKAFFKPIFNYLM